MRWLRAMSAAAAVVVLAACSGGDGSEHAGAVSFREPPSTAPSAPGFELTLTTGETLDLPDIWDERPVVLFFFEPWCETCREQQDEYNELAAEYRDIVRFIGVAGQADPDRVAEYVAEHDVDYPVGTDPDGSRWLKYAVAEPPLVALVGKSGALLRGWPGGISGPQLREQIETHALER